MILIFSEKYDISTDLVLLWLKYYNKEFIRIDDDDFLEICNLTIDETGINYKIKVLNQDIDFNSIKSVWFRRGLANIKFESDQLKNSIKDKLFRKNYAQFLSKERATLIQFINFSLTFKRSINKVEDYLINKLIVLQNAVSVGLTIPSTIITNKISKELKDRNNLITKVISSCNTIEGKNYWTLMLTKAIEPEFLNNISQTFEYSLFQNNIKKKYEIRIFYFNNRFYPMAIFSQEDEQTKTDFRNYNESKRNRVCNYLLPKNIKTKLLKLIKKTGVNSGSIDMIRDINGEYYFLEINPVGQFGMVSYPCNYQIEREIAEFL